MSFPLSLRPTGSADQETEPLFAVLQKIYSERGHLRDVTEESLEAEIKLNGTDGDTGRRSDEYDKDEGGDERSQDIESRAKELQTARTDMLQLIGQANNEALTALDFVSLLLSKDAPRQAELSISPALKSLAPTGTLGFDKTEASKSASTDQDQDRKAALGLNFDSLNSAADRLLASATRLENEIHRETKFWEQILSVSEKGWNLCRIPGRSHAVGVRFGFSEAAPRFRTRGLAPLKPDHDGNVVLDQTVSEEAKALRVRIQDGEVVIETSSKQPMVDTNDHSLDAVVHRARNSLFDEELFFNLLSDARTLFSYGVRIADDQIIFPVGTRKHPDRKILIDLVPASKDAKSSDAEPLADSIALVLRLFLTNMYRNRHRQRSIAPLPLAIEHRQAPHLNTLQPFLCHLQHYMQTNELRELLEALSQSISSAGFKCSITTQHSFIDKLKPNQQKWASIQTNTTPMEHLLMVLDGSLSTTLAINALNSTVISVDVSTNLSPPVLGTYYDLVQKQDQVEDQTKAMTFTEYDQLTEYVGILLRHSIATFLSQNLDNTVLDADGLAVKQGKSAESESMGVLISHGRLALVMRKEGVSAKSRLLGVWDGKSQQSSLLSVAKKAFAP